MTFLMPSQQIQPMTSASLNQDLNSFMSGDQEQEKSSKVPFENYLLQAFNGMNDGIAETALTGLSTTAGHGVKNLHEVAQMAAQTDIMVKFGTAVASKITTAASQLFQMGF